MLDAWCQTIFKQVTIHLAIWLLLFLQSIVLHDDYDVIHENIIYSKLHVMTWF